MREIVVSMTKTTRDLYAKEGLADHLKLIEYLNSVGGYLGKVVDFVVENDADASILA